jgi:hypothetical protein
MSDPLLLGGRRSRCPRGGQWRQPHPNGRHPPPPPRQSGRSPLWFRRCTIVRLTDYYANSPQVRFWNINFTSTWTASRGHSQNFGNPGAGGGGGGGGGQCNGITLFSKISEDLQYAFLAYLRLWRRFFAVPLRHKVPEKKLSFICFRTVFHRFILMPFENRLYL